MDGGSGQRHEGVATSFLNTLEFVASHNLMTLLEPGSDTQVALVKRLRRMLYTKAEHFKTKDQPQFFNYLLDIDEAFNVKRCERTGV